MIFRTIYLAVSREEYPTDFVYEFKKKSRSLCYFLQKRIKQTRFTSDGFDRLVVTAGHSRKQAYINSSKVLCVTVPFNKEIYKSAKSVKEINEYFIGMLSQGICLGEAITPLPSTAIEEGIQQFRKLNYHTIWSTPRRKCIDRGLIAYLECHLGIEAFNLFLVLERKREIIYRERILVTDPDEVAFHYRFKDINFEKRDLVVTSKTSEPLLTTALDTIDTQPVAGTDAAR